MKDRALKDDRTIWEWNIELSFDQVAYPKSGKWVVGLGDTVVF